MRSLLLIAAMVCSCSRPAPAPAPEPIAFEPSQFVALTLQCADKEFPNKPDRVLASDQDLLPPRTTNPAFFGCFDWHSSVHGHWALVRVLNTYPAVPEAAAMRAVLT